jgi:hypothetical protein
MVGADDGSANPPWWLTKTHESYQRHNPTKDTTCFNFKQKGHWSRQCPQKKDKPKLSALFVEEIDPKWWDLFYCAPNE